MVSPLAVAAGKAFILIEAKDQTQKVLNRIGRNLDRFAQRLGKIGLQMAGLGAAIAVPLASSVKVAGDFLETVNKFEVVFKENTRAAEQFASTLANKVGRGIRTTMDAMADFQAFLVGQGFERSQAFELSKVLTERGFDIASLRNLPDEDVFARLRSGLRGEVRAVERFGADIRVVALDAELLAQGIDTGAKSATAQQRALAALNIILRATADDQGDAVRTADSFNNQMKRLNGNIDNLKITIGNALLPTVAKALQQFNRIIQQLERWISVNPQAVREVAMLAAKLVALGLTLKATALALQAMALAISNLMAIAILTPIVAALALNFDDLKKKGMEAFSGINEQQDLLTKDIQNGDLLGALQRVADMGGEIADMFEEMGIRGKLAFEGLRQAALSFADMFADQIIGPIHAFTKAFVGLTISPNPEIADADPRIKALDEAHKQFVENRAKNRTFRVQELAEELTEFTKGAKRRRFDRRNRPRPFPGSPPVPPTDPPGTFDIPRRPLTEDDIRILKRREDIEDLSRRKTPDIVNSAQRFAAAIPAALEKGSLEAARQGALNAIQQRMMKLEERSLEVLKSIDRSLKETREADRLIGLGDPAGVA